MPGRGMPARGDVAEPPRVDVAELIEAMRTAGATVAVAESLTGGLLTAALTGVPGASAVVRGGLVVYATDLKHSLAGVPAEVLDARGPVDPLVATLLASGARARLDASHGIGVTGVAGPDPQDGKPVGTVYVGIAAGDEVRAVSLSLRGSRAEIRDAAVRACLAQLRARFPECAAPHDR